MRISSFIVYRITATPAGDAMVLDYLREFRNLKPVFTSSKPEAALVGLAVAVCCRLFLSLSVWKE